MEETQSTNTKSAMVTEPYRAMWDWYHLRSLVPTCAGVDVDFDRLRICVPQTAENYYCYLSEDRLTVVRVFRENEVTWRLTD